MTFLAPFAWSLLALAAPIVALYLVKTRVRRRPVSTLLFWEQLRAPVHHRSWWRQLRRWVSLALQLIFLALLVAALARPLASWQSAGADAVVLVLDPAASMAATDVAPSRWARALETARRRVASLRSFDEMAVLAVGAPPTILCPWTSNRRTLGRALDTAPGPAGTTAGIRETLALARHLAAGRAHGRVVLLSDGAWAEPPDAATLAGVEWETLGTARPANTALTVFAVRRSLAAPGDWTLVAEARRFGGDAAVSGELEIRCDGRLIDLQNLTLDPAAPEPWRKTWRGHADGAATFEARLRFPNVPDALAADDHATARLEPVGTVDVALVAPANGFLDAALGALPAVRWERRTAGELTAAATTPPALAVFYRQAPPEGWAGNALLVDPPGSGWWGEAGGELANPLVSDVERESVPLRFVGLENVSLGRAREFRPGAGGSVFAASFGRPLVFGRWPGAGVAGRRWLVLPFDLENGDFVQRTAFPVLVGNLVQSLRPAGVMSAGETLPGSVASRLVRTAEPAAGDGVVTTTAGGWTPLAWAPLWWWAALLGAGWLLGEWWLFSRRITE